MSANVRHAVRHIIENIDRRTLELAFKEKDRRLNQVISLESKIKSQVLMSKVLPDISPYSGIERRLPIADARVTLLDSNVDLIKEYVIEYTPEYLNGKEIVNVSDVTTRGFYSGGPTSGGSNPSSLLRAAEPMLNDYKSLAESITRIELLGDNIVIVSIQGIMTHIGSAYLTCNLGTGENFEHILPRQRMAFSKLCRIAAENLIYTKLYTALDEGYIEGGHNISRIKDVVDKFSDAGERYYDELEKWEKLEKFNNYELMENLISLAASGQ